MPTGSHGARGAGRVAALVLVFAAAGCADFGAVRDFGRSAAVVSAYPPAAAAYVESARTSAAFVAGSPESFVSRTQRQQQADDARALHAAVGNYFAMLARLAGDDGLTLATLKSMASDARRVVSGDFDRATINAYADLGQTLTRFAETPARRRAVRSLVEEGGPSAMRLVESLRRVSLDWRAQVANDAKAVDATLGIAALPADVPPLLRILAADRQAELARGYATALRRMRAADEALATVQAAHADLVKRLDDLGAPVARAELRQATTALRAAAADLGLGGAPEPDPMPELP